MHILCFYLVWQSYWYVSCITVLFYLSCWFDLVWNRKALIIFLFSKFPDFRKFCPIQKNRKIHISSWRNFPAFMRYGAIVTGISVDLWKVENVVNFHISHLLARFQRHQKKNLPLKPNWFSEKVLKSSGIWVISVIAHGLWRVYKLC